MVWIGILKVSMEKRLEGGLLNMFSYSLEEENSRDNKDILPVSHPLATLDKYFINAKTKKEFFLLLLRLFFPPNSLLLFHTLFIIADISFIFLFEARLSPVL